MNFRLTMTLVIIVAILATLLLVLPEKTKPSEDASSSTLLLPVKPANLNSFSFISDGVEQLQFVRNGDEWSMAAPVKSPVENAVVQGIATDLAAIGYKQKFEPETSGPHTAEATGTARPDRVVKFTDDTGHDYTIAFGKASVDGVYATFNGGKTIYLLALEKDRNLLDRLDQSPDMFRNKTMSKTDPTKIVALTVKTQNNSVSLEKSDGKWLITAPIHARASATAVDEIVREISSVTAEKFPRIKPQDAMFQAPAVTITAVVQDTAATSAPATAATTAASRPAGTPITLVLSGVYTDISKKNAMYAVIAGADTVFTLRSTSFDKLNRELKDLRDPAISPVPVAGATEFSLAIDGKSLVASKKDDKWTLNGAASVPVAGDTQAIGEFLGVLRDLRAIQYVDHAGDLPSIGLEPPHMKIELTLPGQSQHEVILAGKIQTDVNGGKIVPFMRQGEPTVYQVQFADADRLNATGLSLRDHTIEQVTADHIRGMTLVGADAPGGGTGLEREGTHWVVKTGDKAVAADDSKISAFLSDFTPLSAVKYLDDKPPTGTPAITLTMTIVEPTAPAPATAPSAATAPGTAPATLPAGIAKPEMMGPDPGKTVTRTLRLFKHDENKVITWRGAWDGQDPAWTFEPTRSLIQHVTTETYAPPPASRPSTAPGAGTMPTPAP